MRILSLFLLSLSLVSCTSEQLQSLSGSKLEESEFTVKCESRTKDQYLGTPDYAARGFPTTAAYTEKYCFLKHKGSAWDGPYDSINWRLPIEMSTASSANPDGSPVDPKPYLSLYQINEKSIRKGGVLVGILGQWTGSDSIISHQNEVVIKYGKFTYTVEYTLSPIDDDYISVPTAPTTPNTCVDGVPAICLKDELGNFWNSVMPRSHAQGCPHVIPENKVEDEYCASIPASAKCEAPSVYCADLGPGKRAWTAKIQDKDCKETARWPVLAADVCGK